MTHVPLNAHPKATGPDTSTLERLSSDDEFLSLVEIAELTFRLDYRTPYPGHRNDRRKKVRRS